MTIPPAPDTPPHLGLLPYCRRHYGGNWNALVNGWDIFYPVNKWPPAMRTLWWKPHKDNPERFRLFLFFWDNGIDPDLAANLTLLTSKSQDVAAWRHVRYLANKAANDPDKSWGAQYHFEHYKNPSYKRSHTFDLNKNKRGRIS